MKLSHWTEASVSDLEANGFHRLKPHEFARIKSGTVQFLSYQGKKRDIHIWVNALPLSLPMLRLNMGWRNAAGRTPSDEGRFHLTSGSEGEVGQIQLDLRERLISEAVPKLDRIGSLAALHDVFDESFLAFAAWPKAFCMLQDGNIELGKEHLQKVMQDPLRRDLHAIAHQYIHSDGQQVASLIEQQMALNIRQCRLGKSWR